MVQHPEEYSQQHFLEVPMKHGPNPDIFTRMQGKLQYKASFVKYFPSFLHFAKKLEWLGQLFSSAYNSSEEDGTNN